MSYTSVGKIVILLITCGFISFLIFSNYASSTYRVYDCRDAHWHPDYPIEVKKQCQELMRQQQEKPKLVI